MQPPLLRYGRFCSRQGPCGGFHRLSRRTLACPPFCRVVSLVRGVQNQRGRYCYAVEGEVERQPRCSCLLRARWGIFHPSPREKLGRDEKGGIQQPQLDRIVSQCAVVDNCKSVPARPLLGPASRQHPIRPCQGRADGRPTHQRTRIS